MNAFVQKNSRSLIIAAISLFVGVASVVLFFQVAAIQNLNPVQLTGDAKGYMLLADNIRTQHLFSIATTSPFYPETFRAPGYPFFLALLFSVMGSWAGVLVIQALLFSAAPVLLYLVLRPYHERAAFWGSIIFACEPLRIFYSASLLSDALFMVLLLLALLVLTRVRNVVWAASGAGVLLGASILVRPIAIFLPLLFAGFVLWSTQGLRRGMVRVLILCAAVLIVVLPWSLRNHALYGSYNVSSVGAVNLMTYNAPEFLKFHPSPHAIAVYDHFKTEQDVLSRENALSLERAPAFTAAFRELIRGQELSYLFFHVFKSIPFFVTDGLRDVVRLFNVDIGTMPNITTNLLTGRIGMIGSYLLTGGIAIWLLLAGAAFWGAVTLLSCWLIVNVVRGKADTIWLFFAAIVLYFALLTGPVSNGRYRLPVEGFLMVSAAAVLLKKHEV